MIIRPRIREFICTTAHPTGCAELVRRQVERVSGSCITHVPPRIVVIGCSGGYGMSTRIVATFAGGARSIGVSLERPPESNRTASAGWYSNRAFEELAANAGQYARTIEGDAFSDETKDRVADAIREDFGQIDLLVYSLAAPSRRNPQTGQIHRAAVKPICALNNVKSLNTDNGNVIELDLSPATETDVLDTIAVMGGEDWKLWLDTLESKDLLSPDFYTYHYTYIGSDATRPIYREARSVSPRRTSRKPPGTSMRGWVLSGRVWSPSRRL